MHTRFTSLLLGAILGTFPLTGTAQVGATTDIITGIVRAENGAPIEGAQVEITSLETSAADQGSMVTRSGSHQEWRWPQTASVGRLTVPAGPCLLDLSLWAVQEGTNGSRSSGCS